MLHKHAYDDQVLSEAEIFRWHKAFLNGQITVEDEPHYSQLVISKTEVNLTYHICHNCLGN